MVEGWDSLWDFQIFIESHREFHWESHRAQWDFGRDFRCAIESQPCTTYKYLKYIWSLKLHLLVRTTSATFDKWRTDEEEPTKDRRKKETGIPILKKSKRECISTYGYRPSPPLKIVSFSNLCKMRITKKSNLCHTPFCRFFFKHHWRQVEIPFTIGDKK